MPEYLGKEGNKLLKLIEEPTDNTYLILVANDQERILNTILSRCQLMKFLPFHESTLRAYLINEMSLQKRRQLKFACSSDGSISKAIEGAKGRIKTNQILYLTGFAFVTKETAKKWRPFVNETVSMSPDNQIRFLNTPCIFETYLLFAQQWNFHWNDWKRKAVADKMKAIIDAQKIESIGNTINQLILSQSQRQP